MPTPRKGACHHPSNQARVCSARELLPTPADGPVRPTAHRPRRTPVVASTGPISVLLPRAARFQSTGNQKVLIVCSSHRCSVFSWTILQIPPVPARVDGGQPAHHGRPRLQPRHHPPRIHVCPRRCRPARRPPNPNSWRKGGGRRRQGRAVRGGGGSAGAGLARGQAAALRPLRLQQHVQAHVSPSGA